MVGVWLAVLSGCQDRMFAEQTRAAEHYDEGLALLTAGQVDAAVEELRRATEADPSSPELRLWLGRAWAAGGQHQAAIQAAGEALERRPGWGLAHYNRACWRSLTGQHELAWLDLQKALKSGDVDRLTAAQDPDLEGLRSAPAFAARVPQPVLTFSIQAPGDPVFLGSRWIVAFELEHRDSALPELSLRAAAPEVLQLLEVRELQETEGALSRRRLEFVFKVLGAGEGEFGPWSLTAGDLSAQPKAQPFTFLAPEGHAPAHAPRPLAPLLQFPSRTFSQVPEDSAMRVGAQVLVRGQPGDQLTPQPPGTISVELRERGVVLWRGWSLPVPKGDRVTLTRGQRVLFEESL